MIDGVDHDRFLFTWITSGLPAYVQIRATSTKERTLIHWGLEFYGYLLSRTPVAVGE